MVLEGFKGLTGLDQVRTRWLDTHYAPFKAKSKQKAIYSLCRFIEFLIDQDIEGVGPQEALVAKKSRLEKWHDSFNDEKKEDRSLSTFEFKNNLLERDEFADTGPDSEEYQRCSAMICGVRGKYYHIAGHIHVLIVV